MTTEGKSDILTSVGRRNGRGENLQVRFDYSPSPSWKVYLHYETHHPGDFYAPTRAGAYEVQAQVTYQFAFHIPFRRRRNSAGW